MNHARCACWAILPTLIASLLLTAAATARAGDEWSDLRSAGQTALQQGRYREALEKFSEALKLSTDFADKDPRKLASVIDMAMTTKKLGKLDEAEKYYRRGIDLAELRAKEQPLNLAVTLDNLGCLYSDESRFKEAEALHRRAIELISPILPADDIDLLTCQLNLARVLHEQQKYDEAAAIYEPALDALEKGGHSRQLAIALDNYGGMLTKQGKYDKAVEIRKRALTLLEETLGSDHPEVAISLRNLGEVYLLDHKPAEAEPLLRRALEISTRVLGEDHPITKRNKRALADALRQLGRTEEADELDSQSPRATTQPAAK